MSAQRVTRPSSSLPPDLPLVVSLMAVGAITATVIIVAVADRQLRRLFG